jgi:hypothetical protein
MRTDGVGGVNMRSHVGKCSHRPGSESFLPNIAAQSDASESRLLLGPAESTPRGHCIPWVYVPSWHALCVLCLRADGNHYALVVVALLRGVQVSPSLPWPSSPTRPRLPSRPGSHPVSAAQCQSTRFEMSQHHQGIRTSATRLRLLRFTGRTGIRLAR